MMEGMEDLVGRKLKPEFVEKRKDLILSQHYVITRPDWTNRIFDKLIYSIICLCILCFTGTFR